MGRADHDGGEFEAKYEIDELNSIGFGEFATVHLCWLRSDPDKRYALKAINTKMGDQIALERIHDEIQILRVLGSNPGMVSLVDTDESLPGTIRLVLQYCEGGELYDRIQQLTHYSEVEAKLCCRNLVSTLAYIHGKGIMHRDMKPENILLVSKKSNTNVKIADLGLAKMASPGKLPRSNSICGSDFYLAPEVIKQEEYGREIDIWAVGVICYILLSGALPFFHDLLHRLYRQIIEQDLTFSEAPWKNVSAGATDFIKKLLQLRAEDRPTAAQGLQHPWLASAPKGFEREGSSSSNGSSNGTSSSGSDSD